MEETTAIEDEEDVGEEVSLPAPVYLFLTGFQVLLEGNQITCFWGKLCPVLYQDWVSNDLLSRTLLWLRTKAKLQKGGVYFFSGNAEHPFLGTQWQISEYSYSGC